MQGVCPNRLSCIDVWFLRWQAPDREMSYLFLQGNAFPGTGPMPWA